MYKGDELRLNKAACMNLCLFELKDILLLNKLLLLCSGTSKR